MQTELALIILLDFLKAYTFLGMIAFFSNKPRKSCAEKQNKKSKPNNIFFLQSQKKIEK